MKFEVFSYRYAVEILQHVNFNMVWDEVDSIIRGAPLFVFPNKSGKNAKLDVVQQLCNRYFDRKFAIEHHWLHHPLATGIENSQLRADYWKKFVGRDKAHLSVQAEVQFGNMSRWYTDIFKFQTAYSQKLIQVGLSIVPVQSLARRIDSNVVHFERAIRELPAADLSITLPIVVIGLDVDAKTDIVDVSKCKFDGVKQIIGKGRADNQRRIVDAFLRAAPMRSVNESSPVGPEIPGGFQEDEEE
jgi:hypothetical protein